MADNVAGFNHLDSVLMALGSQLESNPYKNLIAMARLEAAKAQNKKGDADLTKAQNPAIRTSAGSIRASDDAEKTKGENYHKLATIAYWRMADPTNSNFQPDVWKQAVSNTLTPQQVPVMVKWVGNEPGVNPASFIQQVVNTSNKPAAVKNASPSNTPIPSTGGGNNGW